MGDVAGDPPARRAAGRATHRRAGRRLRLGRGARPEPRRRRRRADVDGEPAPLRRAVDDPGFLHAPSIHQAQVAALLRNAHLTHGGGDDDPFAITITSQRVRLAQRIFDGVRAGRSLGAVLGYLVERDLHERGLDASVDNAREVSPLPGQELLPIPARRLDGLALHKLWADSEDHAVDHLVAGSQDEALRRKAAGVLRRLGVAVDAAADLLQAEQVHQFVRGNLTAAVNTLGDIDRGLAPPPDLDFVRTPRTGITVTHRVAVVLPVDAAPTGGWAEAAASPWAAAEPALDAWLARCLGPVAGTTSPWSPATDGAHCPAADLGLTATDFVRIAGAGESGVAELSARAARAVPDLSSGPRCAPTATCSTCSSSAGRCPRSSPLPARSTARSSSRPTPTRNPASTSVSWPTGRRGPGARAGGGHGARRGAGRRGTGPSTPRSRPRGASAGRRRRAGDADEASLRAAADRARAALQARLDEARRSRPRRRRRARHHPAALRALLGPGFVALPRFLAPDADDLVASRDDPALAGDDPLVAETWLMRLERVREPLMRLGVALREAEALGGAPLRLGLAQTPHRPGAAWNGRPARGLRRRRRVAGAGRSRGAGARPPARRAARRRVDRARAVGDRDHRRRVPLRAADRHGAAGAAARGAAGDRRAVDGRRPQPGAARDARPRARAGARPGDLDLVRQFLPATMLAFNTDGDVPSTNPNALHRR